MQQAIKSAEPSMACILVSRDKKAYAQYGPAPSAEQPGQLGDFPPHPGGDRDTIEKMRKLDLADPEYVPESYGSGVVIDARARLILTNYHVVRDAVKVYVRLGQTGKGSNTVEKGSYANIYAADPRSDLAVLQLIDQSLTLKEIRTGNGNALKKGQFVVALSYPFAVGFRVCVSSNRLEPPAIAV